ncbi:MAG TPA: nitroreductase [Verrucomicrobiales bacterium]|nr:nitroreductase [Verrucomicrobiales bacterium]HIL69752.1 nitroreductase [Verrucomicrobiota bacterium]
MDVLDAIIGRASTRAFLDRPVSRGILHKILDTARWAPSGVNSQPWQVCVVTGESKQRISDSIVAAMEAGHKPNPDYRYYTKEFPELYRERQVACGKALYGALGIQREDKQRRKEQWMKNYHGFGAPAEIFIFIESIMEKGSWLDMGMFVQNIMLAARGCGVETCPQAALAEFPDIVRNELKIDSSRHLICGIAVGYADFTDPVNQYRTERESVDQFTEWFD